MLRFIQNHWTSGWRKPLALMAMIMRDSRRKRGRPAALLKNTLTNDLRNIARIAGIDGTNVLNKIGKLDKNKYRRFTIGLLLDDYCLSFHTKLIYIYIYIYIYMLCFYRSVELS